jgi:phospholipid/cholesterol/gamma-HCH transport system substrate-binding protein
VRERIIEILVGIFVLFAAYSLLILAYRVSNFSTRIEPHAYSVYADFDNIGDLKVRSPVTMAGVRIGEVSEIHLDPTTYQATVKMVMTEKDLKIPQDSSIKILTAGLLGAKYLGVTPGFEEDKPLQAEGHFKMAHSALILEDLIGQFLFSMTNKDESSKKESVLAQGNKGK